MNFDSVSNDIAQRQYAQPHESGTEDVLRRAARYVSTAVPEGAKRDAARASFERLMLEKRFCPGGRILAGSETKHGNLLNCLSGDTKVFIQERGFVELGELAGSSAPVLSEDGVYRQAEFRSFGQQELYEVTFSNGQVVKATAGHEWVVGGKAQREKYKRVTTLELEGKTVPVIPSSERPFDLRSDDYKAGMLHGFCFGDGVESRYRVRTRDYRNTVALFGDCIPLQQHFPRADKVDYYDQPCVNGIFLSDVDCKQLPSDDASTTYWYGFFCGLLAVDGHVDRSGSVIFHNKSVDVLSAIAERLQDFGVSYSSIKMTRSHSPYDGSFKPVYGIRLQKSSLLPQDILRPQSLENFLGSLGVMKKSAHLKVESVTPLGIVEEVFCAVEPETHTIVIDGFILTGQCFVQDGSPEPEGTNAYALELAWKLAMVTKVGGGNGVNLDPFPPKRERPASMRIGAVAVTIRDGHPNADELRSGTYYDQVVGRYVTKKYHVLKPRPYGQNREQYYEVIPGDSIDSIWSSARTMVEHMLAGRHVLLDLSLLRAEGTRVEGSGGTSSGPASFAVEVFDNFARWAKLGGAAFAGPVATLRYLFAPTLRVVRQGGTRRGAGMATLSAWHGDLEGFITSKTLAREAAEGDIGTFNISVLASQDFMLGFGSVEDQRRLEMIAKQAWDTGEPGLLFADTINWHNPLLEDSGPILSTNPCGEVPLYPGEPCDLGALNVAEYVTEWGSIDTDALRSDAYTAAEFLDLVLDLERSPLPDIEDAMADKRRLGLGLMGLADALVKMKVPYDSERALNIASDIAVAIREGALRYTEAAARQKGAPDGLQRADLPGRRNIALLTVAPTGTTAMIMGTTSGIEPLFAPFIFRRIGTEYKQILHPLFVSTMRREVPDVDLKQLTERISENHGSVQGLDEVPASVQAVFRCAHDIEPLAHVRMQAAVQRGFDYYIERIGQEAERTFAANSISKTINLPNDATVQSVLDVFIEAHDSGCKGITVYRDGSRQLQVLNTKQQDEGDLEEESIVVETGWNGDLEAAAAASCRLDGFCD